MVRRMAALQPTLARMARPVVRSMHGAGSVAGTVAALARLR
jgi:hypothetical protein